MLMRTIVVAACLLLPVVASAADVWRHGAAELLDLGVSRGLTLSADGRSLELARGRLSQDDGPAAGYSYMPNLEKLDGRVLVRKQLLVDDPRSAETYLLVAPGGKLEATINGRPQTLEPRGKAGNNWEQYLLPPDALRKGLNDIVLGGVGQVWVARDDERPPGDSPPPNRSAKSSDGGKTWNDARLGTKDELDGEYYVRLYFEQHVPRGTWTSPVLDVANLAESPIAPAATKITPVRVSLDGDGAFAIRSGTTLAVDGEHWTDWGRAVPGDAVIPTLRGRFLQVRVELKTDDPRRSPQLRKVHVESDATAAATWTARLRMIEAPSTRIRRSSIPFTFESADHPQLRQLRERHKLDDVVVGAMSEWETILKLAAWSGVQWSKRTGHLGEAYPPWNALDILAKHTDGTPVGGFCQHYNLVFLQACESFGIRGRPVSLGPGDSKLEHRGGHEVVELWSNDYRKWVHVDGDAARYYVDAKSREPLSLLELHDRQLAYLAGREYEPVECLVLADTREPWGGFSSQPPFVELRMIPRSNFLDQPTPVPLNQGMKGWFWPGHEAWSDAEAPAVRLYDRRQSARNNWNWTINETEMRLLAAETPGELRVELDTETPGFVGYEATFDESEPTEIERSFTWVLHRGVNRLVVRSRNETKPLIPTTAVVEWNP